MHHQVQQFSDIRLKSLALTRCVRNCHVASVPVTIASDIAFASGGCKAFALSLFYSQKMQEFAAGQAGPAKPRAGGIDA
jgi:hypothetical protein